MESVAFAARNSIGMTVLVVAAERTSRTQAMKKKPKQDPIFGKDVLRAIDKGTKAKLKPVIRLRDTAKFQAAPLPLRKKMAGALRQKRREALQQIWNPDCE
jgi:hypothetical protein